MRKLTFGFFRANRPVAEAIHAKLLEFVAQPRPIDTSRTATIDESTPVLLRNIASETDGDFLLDFTRIRNVPALPLSDLSGNEDQMTFTDAKRPAEYTVGVFDTVTRVLVVHETSLGLKPSMVAKYWQMMLPNVERFRFDPILEQRAQDEIMTAGAFSKFSFRLAHMGNESHLRNLGLTDDELLSLINTYSSPNISVTFSIDPQSDNTSLAKNRVRELAAALLGLGRKHVKKLALITEDEQGHSFPVDLLKDRIVVKEGLTPEELVEVTHEIRYRTIQSAWGSRKIELRNRYFNVD